MVTNSGDACRVKRLECVILVWGVCVCVMEKTNGCCYVTEMNVPTAERSCISEKPDFDEFGSFYCPHCWFQRVLVEKLMVTDWYQSQVDDSWI